MLEHRELIPAAPSNGAQQRQFSRSSWGPVVIGLTPLESPRLQIILGVTGS
jgi:hypothetical protein